MDARISNRTGLARCDETERMVDAAVLSAIPAHAVLIEVGSGGTVRRKR